jgi:hypothetical protein
MQTSVQKQLTKYARVRTATWRGEGGGEEKRGKNAHICRQAFKKTNKQRCMCAQPRGAGKAEVRKKRGKNAQICGQAFKND